MSDAAAAAALGYCVKISSDVVITQSDIKVLDPIIDTIASDIVVIQSDVKAAGSDIKILDPIIDTIASDLVVTQSDVKVAISDIAEITTLTDKEKSLLGLGVVPGFREFFNTAADLGDPDTTYWSVVENGGGAVRVDNDTANQPGHLECESGTSTNEALVTPKLPVPTPITEATFSLFILASSMLPALVCPNSFTVMLFLLIPSTLKYESKQ